MYGELFLLRKKKSSGIIYKAILLSFELFSLLKMWAHLVNHCSERYEKRKSARYHICAQGNSNQLLNLIGFGNELESNDGH